MNNWILNTRYTLTSPEVTALAEALGISSVTALLLCQRGYADPIAAKRFLYEEGEFHSPFLIPDMEKAVARIERAIATGERVVIYGDYDVDGVTSVSVLSLYLATRGLSADYYIPSRSGEGYGMNNAAIDKLHESGVSLMITVDTGVTAIEEVAYAASLGIDTVVTDHHECQALLPDAVAVVNPRRHDSDYPFKELAGVGVVFKLISACELTLAKSESEQTARMNALCDTYIDLVAMGTIADVMPLTDENRLLVKKGLYIMNTRPRMGLSALLLAASGGEKKPGKISATTISFTVAPRINAAGRIDSAERAARLFLSDSPAEADTIAKELCEINRARQAEENRIIEEAEAKIKAECDLENDRVIVLADDVWHHGVIGIVASRITERYGLPSILISFEGDIGKGSGRSVKGINLVEALTDSRDYLIKFGGHELAAGLSVERDKIDLFRRHLNEYVKAHLSDGEGASGIEVDAEIAASDVTLSLAEDLERLEPFGIANPTPLFMLSGVTLRGVMPLGEKHARFLLEQDGVQLSALRFGKSRQELEYYGSDTVDLLVQVSVNEFRGTRSAQMIVKAIRLSEGSFTVLEEERRRFDELMSGASFDKSEDILPTRDDIAPVYLWFKRHFGNTKDDITGMRELLTQFGSRTHYVKLRVILKILDECGIVAIRYFGENGDNIRYTVNYVKNKVDTEKAPTYSKLKQQMKK